MMLLASSLNTHNRNSRFHLLAFVPARPVWQREKKKRQLHLQQFSKDAENVGRFPSVMFGLKAKLLAFPCCLKRKGTHQLLTVTSRVFVSDRKMQVWAFSVCRTSWLKNIQRRLFNTRSCIIKYRETTRRDVSPAAENFFRNDIPV